MPRDGWTTSIGMSGRFALEYAAYDIVTRGHGSTMTVESEEGKGVTFVITLPY